MTTEQALAQIRARGWDVQFWPIPHDTGVGEVMVPEVRLIIFDPQRWDQEQAIWHGLAHILLGHESVDDFGQATEDAVDVKGMLMAVGLD